MHGSGKLTMKTGKCINANWEEGYRNGEGTITDKDGTKKKVVYYRDLEVQLDRQNPDCYDKAPLNMFFVIAAIAFTVVAIYLDDPAYFGGTALSYIAMLIEVCCSKTGDFVKNV